MKRDLLSIKDLSKEDIYRIIERAMKIKAEGRANSQRLKGYTLGLLFEKASTRTRVSFEVAMFRSGGQTIYLNPADTQLSRDETLEDTARVLSRYLDVIAIRTYSQERLEIFSQNSSIPVINALSDKYHPCQVLSDIMTVIEKKGNIESLKIAWIGDGNNVANSWINAACTLGFQLILACPRGYEPEEIRDATANISITEDVKEAAEDADVLNTDVWVSMGDEREREERLKIFRQYRIDEEVLRVSKPDSIVMHCLPAHRGEEITYDVMDGKRSVVFDQAENKLYLHQALLEVLILDR